MIRVEYCLPVMKSKTKNWRRSRFFLHSHLNINEKIKNNHTSSEPGGLLYIIKVFVADNKHCNLYIDQRTNLIYFRTFFAHK